MKKYFFVGVLITALVLTACGGAETEAVRLPDAIPADFAGRANPLGSEAAMAGAEVYKTNCESCHGSQGLGDGPVAAVLNPAPKNLAELQMQVGDDYLLWRITTGKAGTSMVAWKGILSEEQIWQVISFIRTLK